MREPEDRSSRGADGSPSVEDLLRQIQQLQTEKEALAERIQEVEDALRAISTGVVDALVVYDSDGERIYTLQGADYAYRVMVESIHEGAANINADGVILYCNKRLAEMLATPLENVLGSSFYRYLQENEVRGFQQLAQQGLQDYARAEFCLQAADGSEIPVLITASAAEVNGRRGVSLVITDLKEQKLAMSREKELQVHLMEQREAERVRIARNLHDGPLQDVIGLSYAIQVMMSADDETADTRAGDLREIRENILKLAGDLRSVCNDLRPPNTIRFGLAKAIQYQSDELLAKNPDLSIHLDLAEDGQMLPKNITTTLFRIFQESMNNIVRHAQANMAQVRLALDENLVRLEIEDDGIGYQPPDDWVELARDGHLGLVGMRERAEAAGGYMRILPAEGRGTIIQVEIPCTFRETA